MTDDRSRVAQLLGRPPRSSFDVVVRSPDGDPVVICNPPLLDDGTPMPTRWWLVGRRETEAVSRLEAAGGVREAAEAVDPGELASCHARYAAEREAALPPSYGGPRPSGGVGGTRAGVKCLHAHVAWFLAGGDDPVGRWAARRIGLSRWPATAWLAPSAVAAVDCGTNSTRLLVADGSGRQLERYMRITRLGEGVDRSRRLSGGAISRTLDVLAEYREAMDRHRVESVRAIATSAVRDAGNREDFLLPAEKVIGVGPELLSGEEEGSLSFLGATCSLDPERTYLVADIGGGSTELVIGTGGLVQAVVSVDVGCVRATERFLRSDPPEPSVLASARAAVRDMVGRAARRLPRLEDASRLVGLAGTVSTLAAMNSRVTSYEYGVVHHQLLRRNEVDGLLVAMAGEDREARARRPGLEEGRVDVIVGGALVLSALMEELGFDEVLVSEADILDGLVLSQLSGCARSG